MLGRALNHHKPYAYDRGGSNGGAWYLCLHQYAFYAWAWAGPAARCVRALVGEVTITARWRGSAFVHGALCAWVLSCTCGCVGVPACGLVRTRVRAPARLLVIERVRAAVRVLGALSVPEFVLVFVFVFALVPVPVPVPVPATALVFALMLACVCVCVRVRVRVCACTPTGAAARSKRAR